MCEPSFVTLVQLPKQHLNLYIYIVIQKGAMTRLWVSVSVLTAVPVCVCQISRVTPLLSCSVWSVTEMCWDRQGAINAGSRLFMTNCEVSPQTVGGLVLTPAAAVTVTPSHHSLHTSSLEPCLLLRPRGAPCAH